MKGVLLADALDQALTEADHHNIDAATVQLARSYAEAIDDSTEELSKLGPRLLACLEALLLTPQARAKILSGQDDDDEEPTNPIDELRDRRKRRTEAVDSPAR